MYWIAAVIVMLYVVLFLFARKNRRGKSPPGIMGFFYLIAGYLYDKVYNAGLFVVSNKQVIRDLKALHPGMDEKQVCEEYFIGKIVRSLMLCLVGTVLAAAVSYSAQSQQAMIGGTITRGSYQDGEKEIKVSTELESGEKKEFQVMVYPMELKNTEAEELYIEFARALPDLILEENISLEQVTGSLLLEDTYKNYPFFVEWRSNQPGIVNSLGDVSEVEEATEVVLTATITYKELQWQKEIEVNVVPPMLSGDDRIEKELLKILEDSEKDSRLDLEWRLPVNFQGQNLVWEEISEDFGPIFLIGGFVIAILIFVMGDKDLHDELLLRREYMRRTYPDVVQKLLLYLGAGLTVRVAFQRIASEYHNKNNGNSKVGHTGLIYEEICYMCRELQAGVSEGEAYEHLGRRTGVQEYLRLSTLLAQNLKKGNSTLLHRLQEEAEKAYLERLQNSRKLGEEASTKLLLPMIMFLVVVMLIVMLPAFSSMGT